MHSAPAVSYPVPRSPLLGWTIVATATLGAMTLALWIVQTEHTQARHLGVGLLWLVSAGLAAWHWRQTPAATLTWDGVAWSRVCRNESEWVVPVVMFDVSGCLLLRLHYQQGGVGWACAERSVYPQRWMSFRRAVFGRPPAGDDAASAGANRTQNASAKV